MRATSVTSFILLVFSFTLLSQADQAENLHSDWIVKLSQNDFKTYAETSIRRYEGFSISKISDRFQLVHIITDKALNEIELLKTLRPKFIPVHQYPNTKLEKRDRIPDDLFYDRQSNMDLINLPRVWENTTGGQTVNGEEIVIAVLDDGFQVDHEDLVDNIWVNELEIADDGLDNDNNGFIDDHRGFNVQLQNDDLPIQSHGTSVLGIIGAKGNNGIGVSGTNWNTKIIPIGPMQSIGDILLGMEYVLNMKERYLNSNGMEGANILVTNLSLGISEKFPEDNMTNMDWCAYYDAAGELGVLSVAASPNENDNVDVVGDLPSLCPSNHLIIVTNVDQNGQKVTNAGYSSEHVDIGAPGKHVLTTTVANEYEPFSGTSASSPHVAGAAALLFSTCDKLADMTKSDPEGAVIVVKNAILNSVIERRSLDQTTTGGMLDAYNAFLRISEFCTDQEFLPLSITGIYQNEDRLAFDYETDIFTDHTIDIYDALGRKVHTQTFRPNLLGDLRFRFDKRSVPALASGYYIITLSNDVDRVSKPFFFN